MDPEENSPETKSILASKTFWFNVLALLVTVVTSFGYDQSQAAPEVGSIGAGIIAVINLALRALTSKGVRI